ncbi:MAG TPA: adenylosuccinate synthetase, partial [Flavobacteriaceae bacterium]|nr:adenylosuccinate synthetase [Flavobacteriaceae bacterium]
QGELIDHFPYSIEEEYIQPVYQEFKGWKEDITGARDVDTLPKALKEYIAYIEKEVGVPVTIVSVGPDRTQTIHRS